MIRVFGRISNVLLAVTVSGVSYLLLTVGIPQFSLLATIIKDQTLSTAQKTSLFGSLLSDPLHVLDPQNALALSLSVLVGLNMTLLIFFVRMYRSAPNSMQLAQGIGGFFTALLGFGCAACGSVFFGSVLSSAWGAGLIAALPFAGVEFAFVGMALLLYSSYRLVRYINTPAVCPI